MAEAECKRYFMGRSVVIMGRGSATFRLFFVLRPNQVLTHKSNQAKTRDQAGGFFNSTNKPELNS
jgi:hypothetical protein